MDSVFRIQYACPSSNGKPSVRCGGVSLNFSLISYVSTTVGDQRTSKRREGADNGVVEFSKVARHSTERGSHVVYRVFPTQPRGCLCVPGTTAVAPRSLSSLSSFRRVRCQRRAKVAFAVLRQRSERISSRFPREMSSQICLKWNSFLNNIASSFENLWEEEGLVDVTLASDGQCLTAHKVILSASSPFFKKVFQTNPCQHPVIILQDVRFSELEALLIFIYKGEVNIEQKNLPALLKAAETLQIRGLSGGDIFAKESYKRLAELEQAVSEDNTSTVAKDETPKKKQKVNKQQNNSILETALTPRISQSESTSESTASELSGKDGDYAAQKNLPNPVYQRLEMKMEPLEIATEDRQKRSPVEKDPAERLDTGQIDGSQGSSKPSVTVIADAKEEVSSPPSPEPQTTLRFPIALETTTHWKTSSKSTEDPPDSPTRPQGESAANDLAERSAVVQRPMVSACTATAHSDFLEENAKGAPAYPPFPCPFCDRAYTSWGFRRRHIKAVHTISPSLNCKWCLQVLPTHAAWRRHVISAHNLSASDAHNGLLILEEAHMVLQIARPTRLDALVNIIKRSSQQNSGQDGGSHVDKD